MHKTSLLLLMACILASCSNRNPELLGLIRSHEAMDDVSESLNNDNKRNHRRIEIVFQERGSRLKEKIIRDKADSLRSGTKKLIVLLTTIQQELIQSSGGLDENGIPKAYNKNTVIRTEQSKELKEALPLWYSLLSTKTKDSLESFLDNMKEGMPLSLHLLNLSNIKWTILQLESPLMAKLLTDIDPDPMGKFKKIKISVSAYDNIVEEGKEYRAEITPGLTSDSKTFVKEVTMNGESFPVDSNGIGRVSFVAKADKFNKEGLCRKTWNGSITLHTGYRDSTIAITEEYFVKKRCAR
ncbi:MAG: hypothetical protein ACJ75J_05590 [Cytophagaceae bacterium]